MLHNVLIHISDIKYNFCYTTIMAKKTKRNPKGAGAPKGNKNAEKYDFKKATKLFKQAIELARQTEDYYVGAQKDVRSGYSFEFLGEIAREQNLYRDFYTDLVDRYPKLKPLYNKLKARLEANCYTNGKKGIIHAGMAIMNLKSNYEWTDRVQNDHTTNGQNINKVNVTFSNAS